MRGEGVQALYPVRHAVRGLRPQWQGLDSCRRRRGIPAGQVVAVRRLHDVGSPHGQQWATARRPRGARPGCAATIAASSGEIMNPFYPAFILPLIPLHRGGVIADGRHHTAPATATLQRSSASTKSAAVSGSSAL